MCVMHTHSLNALQSLPEERLAADLQQAVVVLASLGFTTTKASRSMKRKPRLVRDLGNTRPDAATTACSRSVQRRPTLCHVPDGSGLHDPDSCTGRRR